MFCAKSFDDLQFLNINYDYWEKISEFGLTTTLKDLSKELAKLLNHASKTKGELIKFRLTDSRLYEDIPFIFDSYFSSISLLGAALTYYDGYIVYDYSDNEVTFLLVNGAQSIFDAGYTEHSLVFLSYALLRISLGLEYGCENFAHLVVNDYLQRNNLWQHLEKHFIPALKYCIDKNKDMSIESKVWAESLCDKYDMKNMELITSIGGDLPTKDVKTYAPEWLISEGEEVEKDFHKLSKITKIYNIDKIDIIDPTLEKRHRTICNKSAKIIIPLVENKIRDIFTPVIRAFNDDCDFRSIVNSLSEDDLYSDRFTIGSAVNFLFRLRKGNRVTKFKENRSKLVTKSEKIGNSLQILVKACIKNENKEISVRMKKFTKIRNTVAHGGTITLAHSSFLVTYIAQDIPHLIHITDSK